MINIFFNASVPFPHIFTKENNKIKIFNAISLQKFAYLKSSKSFKTNGQANQEQVR